MKAGRSISLDTKIWDSLENYRKKHGLASVSSTMEKLLAEKLGVKIE